ncbi:MAG: leucine-rich repeat domain-containing protein [Ruminococcaceae bacterium]|nr:leucine-rich repeat domain-containing protein [Oscillospiraceae bacterium]
MQQNTGKKNNVKVWATVIILLALLSAAGWIVSRSFVIFLDSASGMKFYSVKSRVINLSDTTYEDYTQLTRCTGLDILDVRGCPGFTAEQYDVLAQSNRSCEILWEIPVEGKLYSSTTETLKLTAPTEADCAMLSYFPNMKHIDATACAPNDAIVAACRELGDVKWSFSLGSRQVTTDDAALDLQGMNLEDDAQLAFILSCVPKIKYAELTDCGLSPQQLVALREQFPEAGARWNFDFYGKPAESDMEQIDISGITVTDLDQFRERMKNFSSIKKVVMCGCGLDNETMAALNSEYPDTQLVWRVYLGPWSLRTDAKSFCTNIGVDNAYRLTDSDIKPLQYCTDLEHLDIGHSGVRDLSPIAGLTKMKTLIVVDSVRSISDLSALKDMKHLQYLEIFVNSISDISVLADKKELLDLNIKYNRIADITPLLGLKQLERCWMGGNPVSQKDRARLEEAIPMCDFNYDFGESTDNWRTNHRFFQMREYFGYDMTVRRAHLGIVCPYDELPENYITHCNDKYSAAE